MKIGDLVVLSAYGNSLDMCYHRRGVVGLVEKVVSRGVSGGQVVHRYNVLWTDTSNPRDAWRYDRRDLKYARGMKDGK